VVQEVRACGFATQVLSPAVDFVTDLGELRDEVAQGLAEEVAQPHSAAELGMQAGPQLTLTPTPTPDPDPTTKPNPNSNPTPKPAHAHAPEPEPKPNTSLGPTSDQAKAAEGKPVDTTPY